MYSQYLLLPLYFIVCICLTILLVIQAMVVNSVFLTLRVMRDTINNP